MDNTNQIKPSLIKRSYTKYFLNTLFPILLNGLLIGLAVGSLVWLYNQGAEHILKFSVKIYSLIGQNLYYLPLLLAILVGLAFLMDYLLKRVPELAGSGIPYTEGVMRGQLKFKKVSMFFGTIFYSFISFLVGLPLGYEGPSIQLGGVIGDSINALEEKKYWKAKGWERISITSGASAGLAVAFNAPLTGIIFALEEGHRRFSPMILLSSASSVIFAILTSQTLSYFTGVTAQKTGDPNAWNFYVFPQLGEKLNAVPISQIWMLLLLGLFIGLSACAFSLMLTYAKKFNERFKIKRIYLLLISYLSIGIIGVFYLDVLGGGAGLIEKITSGNPLDLAWTFLLLILFLKMTTITLSSSSGSTGGLFVPLLAVGSLLGALFGRLFMLMGLDPENYYMIIALSMTALMAAVVRAPLTGTILIAEITGSLSSGFLQGAIVVIIAYFIVELFSVKPLYDELLEGTLHRIHAGKTFQKVEVETVIEDGAFVVGRSIRDVLWPAGCQLLKIVKINSKGEVVTRSGKDGERLIRPGDVYIIKMESYDLEQSLNELHALTCANKNSEKSIKPITD